MKSKVCKKAYCRAKGAEQSVKLFVAVKGNNDGLSRICNTCLYDARVRNTVEVLGNDQYVINYIKYKVGKVHKFVFQWRDGAWMRSQMSIPELNNMVAMYGQA